MTDVWSENEKMRGCRSEFQYHPGQSFKLQKRIATGDDGASVIATEDIPFVGEPGGIATSFQAQTDAIVYEVFNSTTN